MKLQLDAIEMIFKRRSHVRHEKIERCLDWRDKNEKHKNICQGVGIKDSIGNGSAHIAYTKDECDIYW